MSQSQINYIPKPICPSGTTSFLLVRLTTTVFWLIQSSQVITFGAEQSLGVVKAALRIVTHLQIINKQGLLVSASSRHPAHHQHQLSEKIAFLAEQLHLRPHPINELSSMGGWKAWWKLTEDWVTRIYLNPAPTKRI